MALSFACLLLFTAPVTVQSQPDADIDAVLSGMTLRQKIAQMIMVTLHGAALNEPSRTFLQTIQPGAVSLFSDNVVSVESVATLTNAMQQAILDAGGLPLIIAVDQEGGVVSRLAPEAGFTLFPPPMLLGAAGPSASQQMGVAMAEELAAVGVNMNLAPVADLETEPDNNIMARRMFGSDPDMVGSAVAGYISGLQMMNVMATVKHFPGHGDTTTDSHAALPRIDLDRERVEAVELEPFRRAIAAGVQAVMVGHLWYPALDPTPSMPASLSRAVITDLLRLELGFDGLVITDAMDMNAVDLTYNFYDAVILAVQAGVDILALGPATGLDVTRAAIERIAVEVEAGTIDEARIDQSVRRILEAKARYGVLSWQPADVERAVDNVDADGHAALIADVYRQGITLAADREDLVPVDTASRLAIIFLATRYQIRDACSAHAPPERTQWVGVSDEPSQEEILWARSAAADADTVIVFTQNAVQNPAQQALVNALPADRTVAVAIWSPYDWQTYPLVSTYIATYSPARPAVPAACDLLFGALQPSGRLSIWLGDDLPAGSRAD